MRISPSMIGRLHTCPRIPAWILVRDVRFSDATQKGANALGTRCHEHVEHYLRTGALPALEDTLEVTRGETVEIAYPGAIVAEALHTLPAPTSPNLEIEVGAQITRSGLTFFSKADYRVRTPETSKIGDHKFVRDLGSALSSEVGRTNSYDEPNYLGDNVQALILAACELDARPEIGYVDLAWHYTQTRATRGRYPTRVVSLRLDRGAVERGIAAYVLAPASQIDQIKRLRAAPEVLPIRAGSCRTFGRVCEYAEHCKLTDEERGIQAMSTPDQIAPALNETLARLRALAASQTVAAPAPPPAPAAEEPAVPARVGQAHDGAGHRAPRRPRGRRSRARSLRGPRAARPRRAPHAHPRGAGRRLTLAQEGRQAVGALEPAYRAVELGAHP